MYPMNVMCYVVLPAEEANLSRTRNVSPRGARSLIAIECKYYASYLSLHLARSFHGLRSDLWSKFPSSLLICAHNGLSDSLPTTTEVGQMPLSLVRGRRLILRDRYEKLSRSTSQSAG